MNQFVSLIKGKNMNEINKRTLKRILIRHQGYCFDRGIYYIPTTFVHSEHDEWLSLCPCRDRRCNSFDSLDGDYYVCKHHLLIHHCYPGSLSCAMMQGEGDVAYCMYTGNDHIKNALPNNNVPVKHDTNDINSHNNQLQRMPTYIKKSEFLIRGLHRSVEIIIHRILDQRRRREHNEFVHRSTALRCNVLPIFDNVEQECHEHVVADVLHLCESILRCIHDKKMSLLLLKNTNSFVCYMFGISMRGLYVEGKSLRCPCPYSQKFSPMPCNMSLKKIFDIKMTKYAPCMKVLQAIVGDKIFLNAVT